MPDKEIRNQRLDFRQEDVLRINDVLLSDEQYEAEKNRTGIRPHQPGLLQSLAGDDALSAEGGCQAHLNPEVAKAMELLEVKLNYLIGLNMQQQPDHADLTERTVNMSVSGMGFTTDTHYKVGDYLKITLSLPVSPPVILDILARTVRVEAMPGGGAKLGVSFIYRCEKEEDIVTKYIFRRHRESIRMKCRQRTREQTDARPHL